MRSNWTSSPSLKPACTACTPHQVCRSGAVVRAYAPSWGGTAFILSRGMGDAVAVRPSHPAELGQRGASASDAADQVVRLGEQECAAGADSAGKPTKV